MLAHACSKARVEQGLRVVCCPKTRTQLANTLCALTVCSHRALRAAYWVNLEA